MRLVSLMCRSGLYTIFMACQVVTALLLASLLHAFSHFVRIFTHCMQSLLCSNAYRYLCIVSLVMCTMHVPQVLGQHV